LAAAIPMISDRRRLFDLAGTESSRAEPGQPTKGQWVMNNYLAFLLISFLRR
jgi:hypothetical protein